MSLQQSSESNPGTSVVAESGDKPATDPTPAGGATPIADLAGRPDFPQCALGMQIDIMGFTGTVIEVMKQSIRVRSHDGTTQRFNTYRLRQIHGPRVEETRGPEAADVAQEAESKPQPTEPARAAKADPTVQEEPAAAESEFIPNPDFTQPVKPISFYAGRSDFPECALGRHVDVAGFSGVIVAIVKQSLKIRSLDGELRSYNSTVMRKLYGRR